MVQLHLVEERKFPRYGMTQHGAAALFHAKVVLAHPFANEVLFTAGLLDNRTIIGLEKMLPAHIQSIGEIANVHQPQILELTPYLRIKLLIYLAAVHDGRAAAFFSRDHAEEANACGPAVHMRALVVIENALVFGIRSRGVNVATYTFARQVAILGVDFLVYAGRYALEVLGGSQIEAAEENAAVGVQFLCNVFPIVARPVGQIDMHRSRLHHERQRLVWPHLALPDGVELGQVHSFAANGSKSLCG